MCTLASEQLESINTNIKKIILRNISIPGKWTTAITGLNFLRDYGNKKQESQLFKPSIVVIIQGSVWAVIDERKYYCQENHYFITTSPMESYDWINASGKRPFLALLLTLEEHLISQLFPQIAEFSKAESDKTLQNVAINPMNVDLLNCFLRLVGLLDKPEQVHMRAPIIVREIHYLLLISPSGAKLKRLFHHAIQPEKKFKYMPHMKDSVLPLNRISPNGEHQAVRLRPPVSYGIKM